MRVYINNNLIRDYRLLLHETNVHKEREREMFMKREMPIKRERDAHRERGWFHYSII